VVRSTSGGDQHFHDVLVLHERGPVESGAAFVVANVGIGERTALDLVPIEQHPRHLLIAA
jgi:hypothetical protein